MTRREQGTTSAYPGKIMAHGEVLYLIASNLLSIREQDEVHGEKLPEIQRRSEVREVRDESLARNPGVKISRGDRRLPIACSIGSVVWLEIECWHAKFSEILGQASVARPLCLFSHVCRLWMSLCVHISVASSDRVSVGYEATY